MRDRMADVLKRGKELSKESEHQLDTTPHKTHGLEHGHMDEAKFSGDINSLH